MPGEVQLVSDVIHNQGERNSLDQSGQALALFGLAYIHHVRNGVHHRIGHNDRLEVDGLLAGQRDVVGLEGTLSSPHNSASGTPIRYTEYLQIKMTLSRCSLENDAPMSCECISSRAEKADAAVPMWAAQSGLPHVSASQSPDSLRSRLTWA